MTERNDAAIKVLHDSSEPDEYESVMRPISSLCAPDEPPREAESSPREGPAAVGSETAQREETEGERDRFTLIGFAPLAPETSSESSSGEPLERTNAAPVEGESGDLFGSKSSEPLEDVSGESTTSGHAAAAEEASAPSSEVESSVAAEEPAPSASVSVDAVPQITLAMPTPSQVLLPDDGDPEWLDLSTRWLIATGPREAQPVSDQSADPSDPSELEGTEKYHWADSLHVRSKPRTETFGSAPLPPGPLVAAPFHRHITVAYGRPQRHDAPTARFSHPGSLAAPTATDSHGPPHWAAGESHHPTLAGVSSVPEEWRDRHVELARAHGQLGEPNPWQEDASFSDAQYSHGGHPPSSVGVSYFVPPAGTLPPWSGTMPPYVDQPQAAVPPYVTASWNGANHPSVAPDMPPWAAAPDFGMPMPHPQELGPGAYARGERASTPNELVPGSYAQGERRSASNEVAPGAYARGEWGSSTLHGVGAYAPGELPNAYARGAQRPSTLHGVGAFASNQLRASTPPAYGPSERRATLPPGYSPPHRALGTHLVPRSSALPLSREFIFEQCKTLADSWVGAVAKLAVAAMALHYSGLAVPLLARFGYAPAHDAASASTNESAPQTKAPPLAAAGVLAEPPVQPKNAVSVAPQPTEAPTPELREEPEKVPTPSRRYYSKSARRSKHRAREKTEQPGEEHSTRSAQAAHGDSKRPRSASATAATPAAEQAPAEPNLESKPNAQPLSAAEPESEEAVGEALLRINSRPWSQVFVDGTLVGNTPKLDLRVSAGSHRVRLVNPDLNLSKTIQLRAAPGETVTHVVQLDD